tara:strand:+ start:2509 stop:2823 length:315 start_codon:yes stop_codon:yes gene_type:complete
MEVSETSEESKTLESKVSALGPDNAACGIDFSLEGNEDSELSDKEEKRNSSSFGETLLDPCDFESTIEDIELFEDWITISSGELSKLKDFDEELLLESDMIIII